MSAYATWQRPPSARLPSLEPGLPQPDPGTTTAAPIPGGEPTRADTRLVIDALLDRLVDRVAEAVATRLGLAQDDPDEWLDSRQAAEYLGMHRDTLRRLAAARAIPSDQDGRGCRLFFHRTQLDEWRRSGGHSRQLRAIAGAA